MKDYTKAGIAIRALALAGLLALLAWRGRQSEASPPAPEAPLAFSSATPAPAGRQPTGAFAGWRLPVPAGEWLISRGPCGSGGLFTHSCEYYEDRCAIDLTPLSGSMLGVPVLAPQAGQVFFLGTRADSGLVVMLQHDDGRVSALMHLSKVVVGLDQRVAQGQVVAYAGSTGSSTRPHLHFDVQPNAVDRECMPLSGLDEIDFVHMTVRSHNLAWSELVLPNPPERLPDWLPLMPRGTTATGMPHVVLAPAAVSNLPISMADARLGAQGLYYQGQSLAPALKSGGFTLFSVPLRGPAATGDYQAPLLFRATGGRPAGVALTLTYTVRPPADASAALGLIWINPTFVSPANWSTWLKSPKLCWSEFAGAGQAPLSYGVMVTGPETADSGWQSANCWTSPQPRPGAYLWKVFVRDARGYMNRTNQRPYAFWMH